MTRYQTIALIIGGILILAYGLFFMETSRISDENTETDTIRAEVTHVIDGDTIEVQYIDGQYERVRLIGVDAPEIDWETMEDECFGFEAKEFLTKAVRGKQILLMSDASQEPRDSYDRHLAYVVLPESSGSASVNGSLIAGGYAKEYTFTTPYRYRDTFRQLQARAQEEKKGLWGKCM